MGDRGTTKPLAGTFFYVLLALADRNRYGLDIVREVEFGTGGKIRLGPGTLYNAIKKMLAESLIQEVDAPVDDPRGVDPRRRYYGITPDGRARLAAETARLEELVLAARGKNVPA